MIGVNFTLMMGKEVPNPVSRDLVAALQSVTVTHTDAGRSGFQMVFRVGRRDRNDLKDYRLVSDPLFKVFNRVVLVVTFGAAAEVLMDGIITHQQLAPSLETGKSTFTITGEDVSIMMDLEERSKPHTGQDEATIAQMIIKDYQKFGLIPDVKRPRFRDQPTQNERIPTQQGTDLAYLQEIGKRFAHVFYVIPGPKVGTSKAYWGPPLRDTTPQKALTVNMGSFTNVTSISFQNSATMAAIVEGHVQDRKTNEIRPLKNERSRRPPLAKRPALTSQPYHLVQQFRETGRDTAQADARAQAATDRSVDDVITASGDINSTLYGGVLRLRGLVGLRGVGDSYGGLYYVKTVTHTLSQGQYKQSFTITREGLGSTVQRVMI